MKDLFDQFKSITDILNVGRIIFYPAAGALVLFPLYLFVRILLVLPAPDIYTQIVNDLKSIGHLPYPTWTCFVVSTVIGFVIAVVGFAVLEKLTSGIPKDIAADGTDRATSFSYNYPLLRQTSNEDYATWVVSEYFRYVEIATYIPLGGMIGITLITLYVLVYLIRQFAAQTPSGVTTAHVLLVLLLSFLIVMKSYLWPEIWVKQVIVPTYRTWLRAKANLIEAVKAIDRPLGPYKGEPPTRIVVTK